MSKYDVYHQWLGIPPEHQPPTLYRLLGIANFEQDVEVIRNAAERQAMHVRRLARGEYTDAGQELLNEIAQAKLALLNQERRDAYDAQLHDSIGDPNGQASPEELPEKPVGTATIPSDELPDLVSASFTNFTCQKPEAIRIDFGDVSIGRKRWIVGRHADCDFRIERETISGIHCQLTLSRGGVHLSDLNSTNGTYVNQRRIKDSVTITPIDLVTLGRDLRICVPFDELIEQEETPAVALFVGGAKGNEVQLGCATVSPFHARVVASRSKVFIEDLGSKHGTFVQRPGRERTRIKRYTLRKDEIVFFGEMEIQAAEISDLMATELNKRERF